MMHPPRVLSPAQYEEMGLPRTGSSSCFGLPISGRFSSTTLIFVPPLHAAHWLEMAVDLGSHLRWNAPGASGLHRGILRPGQANLQNCDAYAELGVRGIFATILISRGVDLYTVSRLLGHSDIRTSMIYAKARMDTLQEAVDRLELDSGRKQEVR